MTAQIMLGSRELNIDALRGVAILLVVVGHVIQYKNFVEYNDNIVFRAIYSFHMPLFFLISGIVLRKYGRLGSLQSLKNRLQYLLYSWMVWTTAIGVIFYIQNPESLHFTKTIQFYWFIPVLVFYHFTAFIFFSASHSFLNKHIQILFIVCIWMTTFLLNGFWISSIRFHAIHFAIGFVLDKRRCASVKWKFHRFLRPLIYFGTVISWVAIFNLQSKENFTQPYLAFLIRSMVSILGIFLTWQTIALLPAKIKSILSVLGLYSLQIYLVHLFIIQLATIKDSLLSTIIWVILLLSFPIAFTKLVNRSNVSNIFFGK